MSDLDTTALAAVLGSGLASLVTEMPARALTGKQAQRALVDSGASVEELGLSTDGQTIMMASVGSGPRTALVYAYPHPEEPLGAASVVWLAERAAAGDPRLAEVLRRWRLVLVACADPDMASLNDGWVRAGTVDALIRHGFRPEHLAREVDYGFPIDFGPLYQPKWWDGGRTCRHAGRCVDASRCGPVCRRLREPAGPLAESLLLATVIRRFGPDLVVALHNSPVGGAYDFTSWRPSATLVQAFDAISDATGLVRHRGEPPDAARRWRTDRPDLLREPSLADRLRRLARRGLPLDRQHWLGNVSIAQHVQSVLPQARVYMPEATHFSHPAFADQRPAAERHRVDVSRTGRGLEARGVALMPDGSMVAVSYGGRLAHLLGAGRHLAAATVGMLGVEAIARRRWVDSHLERLWRTLPESLRQADDPIAAELRAGPTRRGYRRHLDPRSYRAERPRLASRADVANFAWRVPVELAQRAGLLLRLVCQHDGPDDVRGELEHLIQQLLAPLPYELRRANTRAAGERSQLARLLAVLDEF